MKTSLKNSLSQVKTLLILSLISSLLGVLSVLFDDFLISPITALLALIYIFDSEKRYFSYITSAFLVTVNAAGVFLGLTASLYSIEAIILAFLLCFAFRNKWAKAETSFMMTLIVSIFSILTLIFIPMLEMRTFEFDVVISYYGDLIDSLREIFVSSVMGMYGEIFSYAGLEVGESDFIAVFDSLLSTMLSYLIIVSFIAVGITMKIFSAIYARLAEDKNPVCYWRFMTNNIYAYFYVALMFLAVFTSASTGMLGIAIANLYNIFQIVYAYVGFNVIFVNLGRRFKPAIVALAIIAALLLFSSLTLQLLAVFGVLFTIRKNKESIPKEE